jgi:excisionase family DNA binding protein
MDDTANPIDRRATDVGSTTNSEAEPEPFPEFISIAELATRLGMNVKTVYRQARKGAIPGVRRVGRGYRAHVPTVLSWFAAGPRRDPRRRDRWE